MLDNSNEKQVAKKQEAGLPSDALFEADARKGFENVDTESLTLPILKLLQNGSAEAQRNPEESNLFAVKITLGNFRKTIDFYLETE